MAASTLILGRCEGVERPTLASVFIRKSFCNVDMGSNVDCNPQLAQFAIMGTHYAKIILVKKSKSRIIKYCEEKDKGSLNATSL